MQHLIDAAHRIAPLLVQSGASLALRRISAAAT